MMQNKSTGSLESIIVERVSRLEGGYDSVEKELKRLRDELNSLYRTLHALKSDLITNDVKTKSEVLEKMESMRGELLSRIENLRNILLMQDERIKGEFKDELHRMNLELNNIWEEIQSLRKFIIEREKKLLLWVAFFFIIFSVLQIGLNLFLR